VKILNIRLGFAANSSSTHSFIFLKDGETNITDDTDSQEYGWEFFTAASSKAKLGWLGQVVVENLSSIVGNKLAQIVASSLMGAEIGGGYVDHQSRPSLPRSWDGKGLDLDFLADLRKFILREDLVILGGNDNEETRHPLADVGKSPGSLPFLDYSMDVDNNAIVARKDGPIWTIFNRKTGAKIRMSFDDVKFTSDLSSWRPNAPELVDVKITDWCGQSCAYCYQGSTKNGSHGNKDLIDSIPGHFGDARVFEVAIGGGEPLGYPNFHKLLSSFRYNGVVPNFTTRDLRWLVGPHVTDIVENMGTFGFSVDYPKQITDLGKALAKLDISPSRRPTIHFVVGTNDYILKDIIDRAKQWEFDLTLLGFKDTGRGSEFPRGGKKIDWIAATKQARLQHVRIDTALAVEYKEEIQAAGINDLFYTTEEGQFSWYVDAVKGECGRSSYYPERFRIVDSDNPAEEALEAFRRFSLK